MIDALSMPLKIPVPLVTVPMLYRLPLAQLFLLPHISTDSRSPPTPGPDFPHPIPPENQHPDQPQERKNSRTARTLSSAHVQSQSAFQLAPFLFRNAHKNRTNPARAFRTRFVWPRLTGTYDVGAGLDRKSIHR